ncbi:MAG: hypothetical protein A2W52_03845 [Candidatus Taylorbacteria bacterium RIFCSPHIGHO2_02_49_25]|uniref:2-isopropylmalate synthase LeuA allosteric (dimerisation) domain-containing protein n=2 Tax=Parcubacteria group TaxID=1794811 RepID=A0A1F6YMT8_9BACT|nr:MAG: 2-isopropylmalate synthase/homocitrate synthase family protein [Parcubacteria group bacterium GW2011_GWF2_50_9]OGJ07684.1 MAG: hypothetical protein A2225_02400 [Candidatus Nomurabacteria bacterium RIFOXYA2_FULL_42_12]OHA20906.1 MAG: hypothetical protein A2759_01660 [Candidatus Taylorbacteria bacterium RIFCSPHIGHO2_01_FULL_49_60]OHA22553.1 MAG: hypothetical protein A2W52_03845 [Candidatus Taylorbacteria bacterium RIFCSPHIGHO2_02_49_25]OHA36749.1 MAG: hypothetical protein A2W65_01975 [Can
MKSESTVGLVTRLVPQEKYSQVLDAVRKQEHLGYDFDEANATLELLIARLLDGKKLPFMVTAYHVSMRGEGLNDAKVSHVCEVSIKVLVKGAQFHEVAEGNGPIDALDKALRLALNKSFPSVDSVRLIDYSVGLVPGETTGANAKTRVFMLSTNGSRTWRTSGVDQNVVEASRLALVDSLEYALMPTKCKA